MNLFDAILQGAIQGFTEFLPISSSGHLSLYQYFTGNSGEAGGLFAVLLHLGTLVAVFAAFYKTILELIVEAFCILKDCVTGRLFKTKPSSKRKMIYLLFLSLIPLLFFALFKDFYLSVATDRDIIIEGFCFLITATLLFWADSSIKGTKQANDMTIKDAFIIGIAQGVAPMPGISRSGSTIATGMILGLDKEFAIAFSFIMGIPAVLAATGLELYDVVKAGEGVTISVLPMFVGILTAAVTGFAAIKLVKWLVSNEKFKLFGYYTMILGIVVIAIGIFALL